MYIPSLDFERVAERVQARNDPHKYNPHHGFLSTTRGGKSYAAREGLCPLYPDDRIVTIDVKPGGARTWDGWGNDVTELKPGFGRGPDGTAHYRLMLLRGEAGKPQISDFLSVIKEEGCCVVIIDDSRQVTSNAPGLGLREYVDELLTVGAEIGITAILAVNSSVWATSTVRDQCGFYWIGQTRNIEQRKEFMNYAGLPKESLEALSRLNKYEFLYSDQHDAELRVAITRV